MSKGKYLQIGLMIGFVVLGVLMFHRFAFYLLPLFIVVYIILSRLNQNNKWDMEEEDPADWWKSGEKKNWDI